LGENTTTERNMKNEKDFRFTQISSNDKANNTDGHSLYILFNGKVIGFIIIFISIITLVIGIIMVIPFMYVDFPCGHNTNGDYGFIKTGTRMAYCISESPRQAISGGGIFASGATNSNELSLEGITLKRHDQILFVNNNPINPKGSYETTLYSFTISPWFFFTSHITIINDGIQDIGIPEQIDILIISGYVEEGWFPNPLGLIILGIGIILLITRKK
jgi:hypothetical protein